MERLNAVRAERGAEQVEGGAAGALAAGGWVDPDLGEVGVAAAELEVVAEGDDGVADRRAALLDEPDAAQGRIGEQATERGLDRRRVGGDGFVRVEGEG